MVTPATEPQAPGGLVARVVAPRQVRLEWSPPSDSGGVPIERYEACVVGSYCKTLAGGQTTALFDDLDPDRAVAFTVVAINAAGKRSIAAAHAANVMPQLAAAVRWTHAPEPGTVTGADVDIEFVAAPAQATTRCVLDGAPFACSSPLALRDLAAGTHSLVAVAESSVGVDQTRTLSWTVDRTAPSSRIVELPGLVGGRRAVARYAGADTGGAGLRAFELRTSRARTTGAFDGRTLESDLTNDNRRRHVLALDAGETVCLSVRARDAVGNVGPWRAERCVTRTLAATAMRRIGRWRPVGRRASGGARALGSSRGGATLSTRIGQAEKLTIVAARCVRCGRLRVKLNGTTVRTLNLSSRRKAYRLERIEVALPPNNRGGLVELVARDRRVTLKDIGVHRSR